MNNKKILLIAFKFPPYPEVGAFRWAKFSKYFAKKGYTIHVATVNWIEKHTQSWHKDVISKNIIIHCISSLFIHNLKYYKFSPNILGKFLNKLRNQLIKVFNLFYYIDDAQFWGYKLLPFCLELIKKENIKYVIATGAPFMSNYWASRMKIIMPDIKLIHDLRDEWYEEDRFLISCYKKKNKEFENFTLNNCDSIVTTYIGLKELFSKKINNNNIKQYIIYNGYDKENIDYIFSNKSLNKRDFSFIYAGSLSNNRDLVLDVFLNVVSENVDKLNDIKIYIYCTNCKKVISKYKKLIDTNHLIIEGLLSQEKLFESIYNSFVALHFMPDNQSYIVSVKLFEYGILKRPVLSLNYGGDTDYLIKKHKLGYSINYKENKDEILKVLLELYNKWKSNPDYSINPIDINNYSYENLSDEYLKIIEKI